MATKLQPPGRLGKRKGHDALAKGMGMEKGDHDRHGETNTGRIPQTCQGIQRERHQPIPAEARRGPHNQPKGRRSGSPRLQNLPVIPRPRYETHRILGGTPPQRIHLRVELTIRFPVLLHQKEGRKAPTRPRLPKTE